MHVAPFLYVGSEVLPGGLLRLAPRPGMPWLASAMHADLDATAGAGPPYLARVSRGPPDEPWVTYRLPPGPGVTLSALLQAVDTEGLGWLSVRVLRAVMAAWPLPMTPLAGVLCDAHAQLWFVPPLAALVEGASRTWDSWQFDEYCIAGHSQLGPALGFTLVRMLLKVSLPALLVSDGGTAPRPSTVVPWLEPLDELVASAFDAHRLPDARRAAHGDRWAERLAVLDDRCQESATTPLELLVAQAHRRAAEESRW